MNVDNSFSTLEKLLAISRKAVIFTHINPDGDAIGSGLALVALFKHRNIQSWLIVPNSVSENLRWLPNFDCVIEGAAPEKVEALLKESDVMFFVDFNQISRIEAYRSLVENSGIPRVLIDHHLNPQIEANVVFSKSEVSSTSELIHHVFSLVPNSVFDADYAACVYTGIVTDTGSFSYNSSWPKTFEIVAQLLRLGIDKDEITAKIFKNYSANRLRLLGHVLSQCMEIDAEHHSAFIYLTLEDQHRFDYQEGDSENFVNYPLLIKGIRFCAFLQEKSNEIKVSLRSEGDFAVNHIARIYFNGGGHKNASGGRTHTSLSETIDLLRQVIKNHAHEI